MMGRWVNGIHMDIDGPCAVKSLVTVAVIDQVIKEVVNVPFVICGVQ